MVWEENLEPAGIYNEILPEPLGNPSGSALRISLRLRQCFIIYPPSRHNTVTINCNICWGDVVRKVVETAAVLVLLSSTGRAANSDQSVPAGRSCTAG